MALLLGISSSCLPSGLIVRRENGPSLLKLCRVGYGRGNGNRPRGAAKAFFFNPIEEPIFKEAIKEPVAFMGGMFAGVLRLDLNEDPLKEWVTRTVEAAGITVEEIHGEGSKPDEEAPQEIEIE